MYAVEIDGVSKRFGGVVALDHVDLRVEQGSIHALVGENGAGKSTLMKILSGIYKKDSGSIAINGVVANIHSPQQAQKLGIGIIHQEFSLAPDLSVAENMFLSELSSGMFIDWKNLYRRAADIIENFGFDIDPRAKVETLSVAYQQIIEISKALAKQVKVLILDEPTAVLAGPEIDVLFDHLLRLKQQGVSIIYISHRLDEIFRIADKITVLKDGASVSNLLPDRCTHDDIIHAMVGRELNTIFPKTQDSTTQELLRIDGLNRGSQLIDINFTLNKGEILGIAGLVGAGRTELCRAIFGLDHVDSGAVMKLGNPLSIRSAKQAISHGIAMVPENRKEQGAVLELPISSNMTMANRKQVAPHFGFIQLSEERHICLGLSEKLRLKSASLLHNVASLSGGNQQKVVLAKWLNTDSDVLILDEPTRGVDVGAKSEIYQIIRDLAAEGRGIILVSSELPELVGMSHRVLVMAEGTVTGELTGQEINEQAIMRLALPSRKRVH
ncbi:sugar ABC transporter ATP-binding protein [Vibrio sp. WXL210]|uniref:sugar ABC transporter ATP-binding protein n=1 Tax=Vibrio sp. WXL210 TaxID=3450709 RepID=UPI003EC93063